MGRSPVRSQAIEHFRRVELESRIEEMITLLDMLDEDCDLEDGADAEPSSGVPPLMFNGRPEYDLEDDPGRVA